MRALLALLLGSSLAAQDLPRGKLPACDRVAPQSYPCATPFDQPPVVLNAPQPATGGGPRKTPLVWVYVSDSGVVQAQQIARIAGYDFDVAAIAIAKQLRFTPATLGGHAVAVWFVVPITTGAAPAECSTMAVPISAGWARFVDSTELQNPVGGMLYRYQGFERLAGLPLDVLIYSPTNGSSLEPQAQAFAESLKVLQQHGEISSYEVLSKEDARVKVRDAGLGRDVTLRGATVRVKLRDHAGRDITSYFAVFAEERRYVEFHATYPAGGRVQSTIDDFVRQVLEARAAEPAHCRESSSAGVGGAPKPRVVVTTDPELDDANSLIRYLLYSTDFRTEGLIYASSQFHWKGDGTGKKLSVPNREYSRWGLNLCPCESYRWAPGERFIDKAVETYEQVYPNLRVHNPNYPTPALLKSKIRWGNVEFDGDISKDSPGSDLIKTLLLDDEPGPLYLLAWGGQSTIARALKSIQLQYAGTPEWPAIYQKVSRKAVLSPSGDQDDTYATYIRPNWPDIKTLPAGVGGVALGYEAQVTVSVQDSVYYSTDWTREHISSLGAFGALYRVWGDGKQMVQGDIFDYFGLSGYTAGELKAKGYIVWTPPRPKGEFLGEGDTFTYLNLIDNGLRGYEEATPGGWAGLGARATAAATGQSPLPRITINSYDDLLRLQEGRTRSPSHDPDFTAAAQNGFATRLLWSVTPTYAGANHEPAVKIETDALSSPSPEGRGGQGVRTRLTARPGETIHLEGTASDPDGNAVTVRWWRWKDIDTYPGEVTLSNPASMKTSLQVPVDATAGQTIQLILEATDNGTPALTRYQRVVILVGN